MNTIRNLLTNLCNLLVCARELFQYAVILLWSIFSPKAVLAAKLLAVESQLAVCKQQIASKKHPRPRFTAGFRLLWVVLSKSLDKWEDLVHLMQPATVRKWHTTAFRYFWRWKSRRKGGRPPISKEMQDLIYKLSKENPLWSPERIRDTLVLLQYDPPCDDTIRKYMYKPRKPRKRSTTWLPFLRNHLDVSWAIDFFTVTTINFATLYVFLVFDHGRRKVIHFAITRNPFMNWVIQQLRESMPFGLQPKYLFRDNDGIYGNGVRAFLESCGIKEVRTAYRSPWQNPFVERYIGTLRREMLDHVIVLSQRHLERLLREFIEDYYHIARPHQGLNGDTPVSQTKRPQILGPSKLISVPVLGGLHHRYVRVAA
jgi:transposase InsO family protein